jgi:hypothetical protein
MHILYLHEQSTLLTNPDEWNERIPWPEMLVDYGTGVPKKKIQASPGTPIALNRWVNRVFSWQTIVISATTGLFDVRKPL